METKEKFDIFISYKRISLPTANNLYYRLTTKGYSTFFDLEEMRNDDFDKQLLHYIGNAKDVFVILEEHSLDACKDGTWETDWFCREIIFALEQKKNIIPMLLNGYEMPKEEDMPDALKRLTKQDARKFEITYFDEYLIKLIEKGRITAVPNKKDVWTSIFKFYSNEQTEIYKEGKLVCRLEKDSNEPYYLPVSRKGDYRFQGVNVVTGETKTIDECIDSAEEKNIIISWESSSLLQQQASKEHPAPSSQESKIRAPKRLNHLSLRKILLSVCFSLISIIIVLGTSYTIACNTLRYEYDYSQNTATVVAKKPFFRCSGYVNIPERVKYEGQYFEVCYIGEGAFINNSKLTSVTIPNGVIGIGKRAFAGCPSLTTVTIPHSVLHVGDYAFSKCSSLNSINIQEGTKSIGEGAFYDCKNIKSVDIPNSVTTIGEGAFYDCYGLKSITIGKNVKTIGNRAFYDCHKLTSLTISDSVTTIGDDAFYDCYGLKSITIGKNVKTIGNRAFRGCTSLSDITIPNNVTTIGYAAFKYCLNIQSLTIGNGVTCIKSSAFEDCNKLMTVTIPKSVTEIGKKAFPMHTKIIRE